MVLRAQWNAWYKVIAKFYFSGYVDAAAKNVDLYLNATVRRNDKGLPQVICY